MWKVQRQRDALWKWIWEHRPPRRWVVGIAVATPVAAVIQGVILLSDFRERHSNAPTPVTPSRGVVVAVQTNSSDNGSTNTIASSGWSDLVTQSVVRAPSIMRRTLLSSSDSNLSTEQQQQQHHQQAYYNAAQEPPLRILVIGDSLAAGVGVSQTGTPVLPESIARTLSQRLGGRPVYWTCVGTPGASAARIVHDIETYRESLLVRQSSTSTDLGTMASGFGWKQDLQRRWQSAQARQARIRDWWNNLGKSDPQEVDTNTNGLEDDHVVADDHDDMNKENDDDNPLPAPISKWWKRLREDAREFRRAWSDPHETTKTDKSNNSHNGDDDHDNKEIKVDPFQMWQRWRQRLQRRTSLRHPEIVGQFDIAIVLTGLNDLKEATLPFMFRGDNASLNPRDDGRGLLSELERVLQALQQRMSLVLDRSDDKQNSSHAGAITDKEAEYYTLDDDDKNVEEELFRSIRENEAKLAMRRPSSQRRRPLVVFPGLPVSPLPIFHSKPLRWFALPLIRRIDSYKREVADRFPGEVLFVEAPTDLQFSEIEQGRGSLWDERRREHVLLRLTDITQRARERVEEVMRQHYQKWARSVRLDDKGQSVHDRAAYNHPTPEEAQHSSAEMDKKYQQPRSSLISVDGVHPNDDGYEFWGRHIAWAIIEEWEKQDKSG